MLTHKIYSARMSLLRVTGKQWRTENQFVNFPLNIQATTTKQLKQSLCGCQSIWLTRSSILLRNCIKDGWQKGRFQNDRVKSGRQSRACQRSWQLRDSHPHRREPNTSLRRYHLSGSLGRRNNHRHPVVEQIKHCSVKSNAPAVLVTLGGVATPSTNRSYKMNLAILSCKGQEYSFTIILNLGGDRNV